MFLFIWGLVILISGDILRFSAYRSSSSSMKEDSLGWLCFDEEDVPVELFDLLVLRLLFPLSVVSPRCLLRNIPFSRSIPRSECGVSGSSMSVITAKFSSLFSEGRLCSEISRHREVSIETNRKIILHAVQLWGAVRGHNEWKISSRIFPCLPLYPTLKDLPSVDL